MREERGPIDVDALHAVERVFQTRLNGLLTDVAYVPSAVDPTKLRITIQAGFDADICRFDVQWWTNHGYKYHYVENGVEFRFGWEIRPAYPDKHFHPPDALTEHRESCIVHEEPELVTLAVLRCWWDALRTGDRSLLNGQDDPP